MKTQEELKQLKAEYEALNNKLKELTDVELKEVTGGGYRIKPVTFYVGQFGAIKGSAIQVGDYFTSDEYDGSRTIEVYRLDSKINGSAFAICTKYSAYINTLPAYTIEANVQVSLGGMARIYKPDWIID